MGRRTRSGNSGAAKSSVAALYQRRCILDPAVIDRPTEATASGCTCPTDHRSLFISHDVLFPDLLFNLTAPAFGNPRTQEPVKQINQKQNRRHPFVVQGGEEHDENDGG